jgi:carbonic anhydrase
MPDPAEMLANNRLWARDVVERDPDFFHRLAEQQAPDCLWIGCSDSRVPATQIVDVPPGEIFVHRNVANQVIHSDLNCQSVIQFAVDVLVVKHILICGHYHCSGIAAAAENERHGLVDHWLRNLVDLFESHRPMLDAVKDDKRRRQLQSELGVIQQVSNVSTTTTVRDAWSRGQDLHIHGWVYDVADGLVKDLKVTLGPDSDNAAVINQAIRKAGEAALEE